MLRTSILCFAPILSFALAAASPGDLRITGPYTHENLSIFLIHGGANPAGRNLLTLQEAMDQKKVVVYETGQVNELSIENVSPDDVYIQSGDIVKGGRQDRVFPTDMILTSHSGKVPISAFCVEHGRWTKRGAEAADQFSGSTQTVAFKDLKMAVRTKNAQAQVWDRVANAEQLVTVSAAVPVSASLSASPTSMQLALENKQVVAARTEYVRDLSKIIDGKPDVVGFVYAVNGKVSGADQYASNDLFRRMWPKLLNSSATEALGERVKGKTFAAPEPAAVQSAIAAADGGQESSKEASGHLRVTKKESDKAVLYESRDAAAGSALHKSYIIK